MTRLLTLITLLFFLVNCNPKTEDDFQNLIKGNWETTEDNTTSELSFFFFENDSIAGFKNTLVKYSTSGKLLRLYYPRYEYMDVHPEATFYDFKIKNINDSLLILLAHNKRAIQLLQNQNSILRLRKLKPQNDIQPQKIQYFHDEAYGLEIKDNGSFTGLVNDSTVFNGQLSALNWKNVLTQIHCIDFEKFKEIDFVENSKWTHQTTQCISLLVDGKKYTSCIYGGYFDDHALNNLATKLNYFFDFEHKKKPISEDFQEMIDEHHLILNNIWKNKK